VFGALDNVILSAIFGNLLVDEFLDFGGLFWVVVVVGVSGQGCRGGWGASWVALLPRLPVRLSGQPSAPHSLSQPAQPTNKPKNNQLKKHN
jgi:hypothetical protein